MKVAIDAGPLYGHRTGVGEAVDGMLAALSVRDDLELTPYLVSGRSTPLPGHRRLPVPGIVASHLWSRADRPFADRWMGDADLVHGTNYVAPPTRLPTVVSVYDCWFLAQPDLASPLVGRAGQNLRRAADRGAWIHTSSEATARTARELLDTDRVVTVYLGAPDAPPPIDPSVTGDVADEIDDRTFVVAIGTEERRKDLRLLIGAFAHLSDDDARLQLVIAGAPGDETAAVTAAIAALPAEVGARVHRLGKVDESTKQWLLQHASVLAYPSLDEGFGFPILEAQRVGTPVVASAVGSIPEIGGEGVATVSGRDPIAFAEMLGTVLRSETTAQHLIDAGHRNVGRFSWDSTAGALTDLYRRAMED